MKKDCGSTLSKYSFPLAFALVALSIGISSWQAIVPYVEHPYRNVTLEVDWGYLNHGLDKIHSFRDTLRWWTGTWCGEVPFWRPLSSYVFLGMRLIWDKDYLLPRQILCVLAHLGFVIVSYYFIQRLTGRRWLGLVTVWLFAGYRPLPLFYISQLRPVAQTLEDPKNIPDPLVGICVVASLLFLSKGRWFLGLVMAILGVCFKEIGFTTWPLGLLMLLWMNRGNLRRLPLRDKVSRTLLPISMWLLGLLLLVGVHWLSIGAGYRLGTNKTWLWRMCTYLSGSFVNTLFSRNSAAALTALLLLLVLRLLWRTYLPVKIAGVMTAFAIGAIVDQWLIREGFSVSLVRLLSFDCLLSDVLACLLWLLIAWEGRGDWQTVVVGWAMAFISALPTWAGAQVQAHARYLSSLFMEIAVAAAVVQAGKRLLLIQYKFGKSGFS